MIATLQRCIKIKFSSADKAVLRRLIIDELFLHKHENLSSEELINHIEKQAIEFMETCTLEAVVGEREICLSGQ